MNSQAVLLPGFQLDVVVIDGTAVIVVVGIAKHEEVWNSRTCRIHGAQRYRPNIRLLSAPLEAAGNGEHKGAFIALDTSRIPGIVLVRIHSANCARGLKRTVGPGQKRTACAVFVVTILVYAKHHNRMLTVSYPLLALPDIGPCILVVVGIDRDLAMVMNPKIVVRPWSRIQNREPVEAILQARLSVEPRLFRFSPSIPVETGCPRLPFSTRNNTPTPPNR